MLAMQYSVRLPEEYDKEKISQHVAERRALFAGCPGLRHKFYLYDSDEHVYAPFYIWENGQVAQNFLLNNLFKGVVAAFGRPRVRSWHVVEFDYGPSSEDPGFLCGAIDKVPAKKPVSELMAEERIHHKSMLDKPGLFANMVLLDPDRWEKGQFSLWHTQAQAVPGKADCVNGYDVLDSYQSLQVVAQAQPLNTKSSF
ncbi:DUF4865 family protein [Sneathiella sp.]|uniref:DUF4865 family protein n=1 Tax=Sneathiella sp. TaxID=1964365 RepID=UPI0035660E6E